MAEGTPVRLPPAEGVGGRSVVIRGAAPADAAAWARLRAELWPVDGGHADEIALALAAPDPDRLTLLAFAGDEPVGLAEATIRHDYVNGCDTTPVAFLEGLYVAEPMRRQGVARALADRVAAWGRAKGCIELASDALADNVASHAMHAALGFAETERVIFFRRMLPA